MKLFTKVAACALAASIATLTIAPAQAEDQVQATDYTNEYIRRFSSYECQDVENTARTHLLLTYSEYYNFYAKHMILEMRTNKRFTVDANAVSTAAANRALECGVVSKDLASSTKGSAKSFGSSIASLSS